MVDNTRSGALARPSSSSRTIRSVVPPRRRSFLRRLWLPVFFVLALTAGGLTGIILAYELNSSNAASEVSALATYRPSVITRVYADDGKTVIGEFALERRIPLRYEEIPKNVKDAILAVEDTRFYEHVGIDPIRIAGASYINLTTNRVEGGSTLTQQLARNLFLTREQTFTRKFKEWLVALQIERFYTKNKILEMYVNNIFLGARAYGFEAAAETYFGKKAKELTLDEAALIAGIPKSTTKYNPTLNPEESKERRNLVLDLMARNGFVSQSEADAAKMRPVKVVDTAYYQPPTALTGFGYPVEEIRQYLEEKYTTRVALGGLTVYSTINVEAQRKAQEAIRTGLRQYDRGRGWRSEYDNISTAGNDGTREPTAQELKNFVHLDWYGNDYETDEYVMGIIMAIDGKKNEATARFGGYTATVTAKDMGWSGRQPKTEFTIGDLAQFKIKTVDDDARRLTVDLTQIPKVQAALYSENAKNGEVVAMIGGYDFNTNKFNNATQAYRQTGSAFKPFVYTAAVEWGLSPDSLVSGAPMRRGSWQPHNYDGSTSHGNVPMKTALAKSLNLAAVHLLDTVGIQTGSQMVRRFGITVPMAPYLPSALGATEVPLDEMVSAYSAFPNKGIRMEPHLIRRVTDMDGNILEAFDKTTFKVTSEYVALTMVEMMQGVTSAGGTAPGASSIGHPTAGKTGTVNDHTDVWFVGYTPTYVTGVWMGYPDRKINLGSGMTGGRGALPIWVDYMKEFMKDKPKETFEKAPKMPEDIKELFEQRQREQAEEREALAALYASSRPRGSDNDGGSPNNYDDLPTLFSDQPKLEQITLPPPPSANSGSTSSGDSTPIIKEVKPEAAPPPPPPPASRTPEPAKRRGKKGEEEP
ncbi:MAG: PBP1A family penicillin-binding protein [Pyrinomonadaceae bacterium MAG19_C2-C3]|nr:PBP1A family penicillin-binding protein [Pyrinomonadaceae bacterium MAG19_C2-C3]